MYTDASDTPFTLSGLEPETEYVITVQGRNELGDSGYQSTGVSVFTSATVTSKPIILKPEEPMFIIIMALAVVGGLLLIVTTVLVFIFIRRRRKRKLSEGTDSASQSNTTELYGTHYNHSVDDVKSYGTYEKEIDDDFAKNYEDDNESDVINPNSKETYLTKDPAPTRSPPPLSQPWSKTEDPQGLFGAYSKKPSFGSTMEQEFYANELRNLSSKQTGNRDSYKRPDFAKNRPPAPPIPGSSRPSYYGLMPPMIPERNYSPENNYVPHIYPGARSTPSVASVDSMRGHLV